MKTITNRESGTYATRREEFKTRHESLYGKQMGNLYVVFSYGDHFPIYAYDEAAGTWFGNKDKYSSSTSRHQSYARPGTWECRPEITMLGTGDMRTLADQRGVTGLVASKFPQRIAA